MEASCWVARKIFLSPFNASSSARTLDSRPTTNGVIMKGKMTTSRMGIMGSLRLSKRSWLWLTFSSLDTGFSPVLALLSRAYYTRGCAATVQNVHVITKVTEEVAVLRGRCKMARFPTFHGSSDQQVAMSSTQGAAPELSTSS